MEEEIPYYMYCNEGANFGQLAISGRAHEAI